MLYILSYDRTASCQISNNFVRTAAAVRLEQWGVAREQCQSQAPWRSSKSRISPESKKKLASLDLENPGSQAGNPGGKNVISDRGLRNRKTGRSSQFCGLK